MSNALTAISLDRGKLCAVHAVVGADQVKVKAWLSVAVPDGVDAKDASVLGVWLAGELDKAGIGKGRLVFAVPRGEVVLKPLKLPKGTGEAEVAGMVRLQMTRQLTMAVEGTAIDYATIGVSGGGEGSETVSVLAAALPGERMAWYREVAKSAGCKLERVGLRAAGVAALLSAVSQRHNGPVLGIAAGWGSVEFVVVADGQLVFARSADVGEIGGTEFAAKAAVEAKRTWMSFRGAEGSVEVEAVVMPGGGATARDVGQRCAEALELPFEMVDLPSMVEVPAVPADEALVMAPLIGLLVEKMVGRGMLDFAHPRKAPDLAAAKRQRMLLGVLGVILLGGGGAVFGMKGLADARTELREAQEQGAALRKEHTQYLTKTARLGHVQQWTGAKVDWLAHLNFLSEQMPDPRQALMDQVGGSLAAEALMVPKGSAYDPAGWQRRQVAAFSVQGHTKQRDIADALRDRLVGAEGIYEVQTKGPDTPDQFSLVLRTSLPTPEAPPAPTKKAEKGAGQ